jgi:DNA mismatch endonuclease (patch repair protein)
MSGISGRDTLPELAVRRALHAAGLRFRVHKRDLPGSPDIVLSKLRSVVFVHGCFWHRHPQCRFATTPSTNRAFWLAKFKENTERDTRQVRRLRTLGWRVFVIWECKAYDDKHLASVIKRIRS